GAAVNHEIGRPPSGRLHDGVLHRPEKQFLAADPKPSPILKRSTSADRTAVHPDPVARSSIFDARALVSHNDAGVRSGHQRIIDRKATVCTATNVQFTQWKVHFVKQKSESVSRQQ